MISPESSLGDLRASWVADLDLVSRRDRWGRALIAVGWVHLGFFLACQAMHHSGDRRGWHYVAAWGLEFGAVLLTLRRLAGPRWMRASPLAGIVARTWGTVLILSFNLASMNSLTGLDHEWFKPALCTLASFGFMMMAYLVHRLFFALAVQMYFTGLLMVRYLDLAYLIHGVSWWMALLAVGGAMEVRRRRLERRPEPITIRVIAPPSGLRPGLRTARRP